MKKLTNFLLASLCTLGVAAQDPIESYRFLPAQPLHSNPSIEELVQTTKDRFFHEGNISLARFKGTIQGEFAPYQANVSGESEYIIMEFIHHEKLAHQSLVLYFHESGKDVAQIFYDYQVDGTIDEYYEIPLLDLYIRIPPKNQKYRKEINLAVKDDFMYALRRLAQQHFVRKNIEKGDFTDEYNVKTH